MHMCCSLAGIAGARSAHSQGYDQVIQLRHSYLLGVPYFTKVPNFGPGGSQFTRNWGRGGPQLYPLLRDNGRKCSYGSSGLGRLPGLGDRPHSEVCSERFPSVVSSGGDRSSRSRTPRQGRMQEFFKGGARLIKVIRKWAWTPKGGGCGRGICLLPREARKLLILSK